MFSSGELDEPRCLEFIKNAYICRELAEGITRYCDQNILKGINEAIRNGDDNIFQNTSNEECASNALAQVAELVLKDVRHAEYQTPTSTTHAGIQVLHTLQNLVFKNGNNNEPIAYSILQGTFHQAIVAQKLCTSALIDALNPQNCFSIASLARNTGCRQLLKLSEEYCLRHFQTAIYCNVDGLLALQEDEIIGLLTSDALQVDSELDVFKALSTWVEGRLNERQSRFVPLLTKCVRLGQLSLPDLTFMLEESHLLASDSKALEITALSLIERYAGVPIDDEKANSVHDDDDDDVFEIDYTRRPRHCQQDDGSSIEESRPLHALFTTISTITDTECYNNTVDACVLRSSLHRLNSMNNIADESKEIPLSASKQNSIENLLEGLELK